jgi:hypothetical protein
MNNHTPEITYQNENNKNKIFRYKFDKEVVNEMYKFSKEHKDLSKKDFTDNWERWKISHSEMIQNEVNRLQSIGCTGDIEKKLFRSSRYYLSKKKEESTPKQRRKYVSLDRDFIEIMDNHIQQHFSGNSDRSSPKECYSDFASNSASHIENEIDRMFQDDNFSRQEGQLKIKKTYKNRVYQFLLKK